MKNIFDFATKELSQDAFLRWLFENYCDEELGNIVIDFINYFTDKRDDKMNYPIKLKKDDIKEIKTTAQLENIDITVDIYFKDENREHISLVIEDKTFSKVGNNQLKEYNKKIQNWKYGVLTPKECVYKIFYKTSIVKGDELEKVKQAGWNPFSINEIYSFFVNYKNKTTSQIFNQYVDHICNLFKDYYELPQTNPGDWNAANWKKYTEYILNKKYGKSGDKIEYFCDNYNGFYNSVQIKYRLPFNKYMLKVNFELLIRDKINGFLRPIFFVPDYDGEIWSINGVGKFYDKCNCEKELIECREFIAKKNNPSFLRKNTARSIAKMADCIDYKSLTINQFENEFLKIIDIYINLMNEFCSSLKTVV